ncbi:MAG: formate dehydrogenase accessory sulfurtransferase FdhD [Clostridiales bacterium]|nr:formate dehydrogenase accessory sulfurtransferase FdhD [Clostridiales bacterium]
MELTRQVMLTRYDRGDIEEVEDIVVIEYPLTIYLNDEELVTLLCSPASLEFLVIGFLLSESIIKTKDEINSIRIDRSKGIAYVKTNTPKDMAKYFMGKRMLTTGCGRGTTFYNIYDSMNCGIINSDLKISYDKILSLMKVFAAKSQVFQSTGGVHSAALSQDEEILFFQEDVGRHNALDKVLGEAFMKDIDFSKTLLLTSGRISSEMLLKAGKRGISTVVSRSAPMDLALKMGIELNMTIVGFARGQRMNVYTGKERIIW